jgi:predicted Zn-dependent peptidase
LTSQAVAPATQACRQAFVVLAVIAAALASLALPARALNVDVSHFTLDNGMQVVVIPDHRAPVVTHMVWYRVGSADEPKGKAGIAHFLEHLLFKGTETLEPGEFSRIVRRHGGQDNAFTSRDYTGYFQRISRDHLGLVMSMEADRMVNLEITDEDVATELDVVLEERRSRIDNDPQALLSEQVTAALYTAHPYGIPIIGWMSEVSQLTRQDAIDFYRTYYTPSNAMVVIAGDVTAEEVRELVDEHYAPLENTAEPGPRANARARAHRRAPGADGGRARRHPAGAAHISGSELHRGRARRGGGPRGAGPGAWRRRHQPDLPGAGGGVRAGGCSRRGLFRRWAR